MLWTDYMLWSSTPTLHFFFFSFSQFLRIHALRLTRSSPLLERLREASLPLGSSQEISLFPSLGSSIPAPLVSWSDYHYSGR